MALVKRQVTIGFYNDVTATSVSVTGSFALTTLPNSLLICACSAVTYSLGSGGAVATINTPSTPGITWIPLATVFNPTLYSGEYTVTLSLFYAANSPSVSSAAITTVNATAPIVGGHTPDIATGFWMAEITGAALFNAVDSFLSNTGTNSIPSAGNIVNANTDLLLVCELDFNGGSGSRGASYNQFSSGGFQVVFGQDRTNLAPGTYSTSFGSSLSYPWAVIAAAFKTAPTGFPHAFGSLIGF